MAPTDSSRWRSATSTVTSAQWQEPQNSTSMPAATPRIHVWSLRSSD